VFAKSASARAFTAVEKRFILDTLNDARAWPVGPWISRSPASITRVVEPRWTVSLETSDYINRLAGPTVNGLSATWMSTHVSWLSYENWTSVPSAVRAIYTLEDYRRYLILHECGHALGLDHPQPDWALPKTGPCPVMKQQTLGLGRYQPNVWPLRQEKDVLLKSFK
jgi:hypothetical protein